MPRKKSLPKVVIRSDRAGIFYGDLEKFDPATSVVTMCNCRRIWYWSGARSLSQIAQEGVKHPKKSHITVSVDKMLIMGVVEVLYCTEKAIKNLNAVPVWKIR